MNKSYEWIVERLHFYLQSEDVIIEDVFEDNQHILKLRPKDIDSYDIYRSVDLLFTKSVESGINYAYSTFYDG